MFLVTVERIGPSAQIPARMSVFSTSVVEADKLLVKAKKVTKGESMAEAGIEPAWLSAYGKVARRCRDDKDFGLSRYPYERGPGVGAFTGGFFEHREWPLRKGLEKHSSLRPICEHEANYINATGYWMSFHEAAIALRQEAIDDKSDEDALKFDVWALISVRYGLRVVGLRSEFYKMAAKDPVHAKMVLPNLQRRNDVAASDDLVEALEKLDSHMSSQLGPVA